MLERQIVALAVAAGRKRQRPQTGWVHLCYESEGGIHDTIPLFENLCFALALFRSRLSENILEGKALVEKILAFEVSGNFPVYLHEYPLCKDSFLAQKMYPAFYWIFNGFKTLLGEELKEKLRALLEKIGQPYLPRTPATASEWAKRLIGMQVQPPSDFEEQVQEAASHWNQELLCYMAPAEKQLQEKTEPALTLYDLFMGQLFGTLSKRAQQDHPLHLQAALIHPFSCSPPLSTGCSFLNLERGVYLAWGGGEQLHTLVCHPKKATLIAPLLFQLSEVLPQEGEESMEICFFCNIHPDNQIYVNGAFATTFQLGDQIQIRSKEKQIELVFSKGEKGEGVFFGHISRANRPGQLSCRGEKRFEAYDWQISLRTICRSSLCTIQVGLSVGLSQESPIACIPLST